MGQNRMINSVFMCVFIYGGKVIFSVMFFNLLLTKSDASFAISQSV